ncbi:hypothetical protein R6Q59_035167 [Mikania micrantha]
MVPLSYPKLCVQLFEGSMSNGFDSWGSSSILSHPLDEASDHNSNGIDVFDCTQMEPPSQGVSEATSVRSKKGDKKRKAKETLNSKLIEVGDQITKVANVLIEKHNLSTDMNACMEKLATMGWDELDARYQTTLLLFGESANIRKV